VFLLLFVLFVVAARHAGAPVRGAMPASTPREPKSQLV